MLEFGNELFEYELVDVEVFRLFVSKSEGTSEGGGFGGRWEGVPHFAMESRFPADAARVEVWLPEAAEPEFLPPAWEELWFEWL